MDKELKEIFREKNRLLIITNLKYDLEKNIDSLLNTISNILSLEFDTAIKNMISIHVDSEVYESDSFIKNLINNMKQECYRKLETLLTIKSNILKKKIDCLQFEENCLNEYYELIFHTTKEFRNNFSLYITKLQDDKLKEFHKFIVRYIAAEKETLTVSRVTDYLNNRLFGKLETKIHMEIMLRDNNLINKGKESYLRFQEISSKTTEN